MASGLQQIVGIADGGPTAAILGQQTAADASEGPASFLSALDQALAVQSPAAELQPAPQPAAPQDAAPAPAADAGQTAPRLTDAQLQDSQSTPESAQPAARHDASENTQAAAAQSEQADKPRSPDDKGQDHPAKAKKGQAGDAAEPSATQLVAAQSAAAHSPATQSPSAHDVKQVPAEGADVQTGAQKPAAASKQQARAPVAKQQAAQPVQQRANDTRQANGQAQARMAQTMPAQQPAAASQVKTTAQNTLATPKGAADQASGLGTAAAQKGLGDASPGAVRYAAVQQAQTTAAATTAAVQKAAPDQDSAEDVKQPAGRAKSARAKTTEAAAAPAGKSKAGQSGASGAAEQAGKSSTAAGTAPKATDAAAATAVAAADAAGGKGHGASTAQAAQQEAGATPMTAWGRYNATAGDGYRQQVQTLAGRSTSDMSAEIIRQSQYIRQNGDATMRLQLNPPEMGRIKLEVQMRSGELHVRMRVENPDVREAMTRELPNLDRTLQGAQVQVQSFEVTDYQSGPQNGGRGASADTGSSGQTGADPKAQGGQDSTSTGWARISASGSVDCLV